MSRRILIFSLGYYPYMVGGAEIAIKEITERIPVKDIEFDMVTLRYDSTLPKVEKIGNVTVYRIGFSKKHPTARELIRFPMYLVKVWYPLGAFLKGWSLHKKNHYDAMWSMMSYMGFPALFLKTMFPKITFILTLQEGDTISHITQRWRIRLVSFLYRAIFRKANKVQVISTYLEGFARDMGYTGDVFVIPNGVDIMHFSRKDDAYELYKIKEKINKKDEDVLLVTTSRLVAKNAIEDCIRSLVLLPAHIKLLIIGEGPLREELEKQVNDLALNDRVIFLGYVAHKELPAYLKIADIFIRPSLSEGMGNSFLEAMAAGIPVIATSVGGIRDFLRDGETGVVVEVHNPDNIAQKIEKLLKDIESRDYIIRQAKIMIEERYDWNTITTEMKAQVLT